MVTAPNMDKFPSISLEPGYDFAAVHTSIIHTIHNTSIGFLQNYFTPGLEIFCYSLKPLLISLTVGVAFALFARLRANRCMINDTRHLVAGRGGGCHIFY
jgi:hypothetical protein